MIANGAARKALPALGRREGQVTRVGRQLFWPAGWENTQDAALGPRSSTGPGDPGKSRPERRFGYRSAAS
jgi:hypothetical protein